jgi:glycine hydroxymethyltransferase
MHVIAAKAVAFKEALSPEFAAYQMNVVKNANALARGLMETGLQLVSGGTDNHMMLVDLRQHGITGKEAEDVLGRAGITVNKNAIPFDPLSPLVTSGFRIGTPAVTSRGMREPEMAVIAALIDETLKKRGSDAELRRIRSKTIDLCNSFPLYPEFGTEAF